MDAGLSLVLALIAFVSFGLIYFRVRDAASDLWRAYGPREPSIVSDDHLPIVMSRSDMEAPSESVRPRTDETADGRTNSISSEFRPATLDMCKSLRSHGFTRDEARAFLRSVDRTLGNDVWAAAQPAAQPAAPAITPIAGRPYDPRAYADDPALAYEEPPR